MKTLKLVVLLCITASASAQLDSSNKKYRHEFGTDVTSFIKQFLRYDNTTAQYGPEIPVYSISYRYHLAKSNIRAGIGGYYSNVTVPGYSVNSIEKVFHNKVTKSNIRIGYEWYSNFSKRWHCYYGADVVYARQIINQEAQNSNAGYIGGYKSADISYKAGPVLGFRFCFNQRLSLTTETSFLVGVINSSWQRTYLSQDQSLYPTLPNSRPNNTTNLSAAFTQPLSLFLTVKL